MVPYIFVHIQTTIHKSHEPPLSYFCGTVDFIDNFVYLENIHTLKCKKKKFKNTYICISISWTVPSQSWQKPPLLSCFVHHNKWWQGQQHHNSLETWTDWILQQNNYCTCTCISFYFINCFCGVIQQFWSSRRAIPFRYSKLSRHMYEKVVELSPIPQKQPMGKNSPFTCIHKIRFYIDIDFH